MSLELLSPIPGKILKILVNIGVKVVEDEELMKIESMKMENAIYAPISGTIKTIHIKENDDVQVDDLLMVIEA